MSPSSPQRITARLATSEPRYIQYPRPPAGAPNIVTIVLDDVGFAQLGCFGGPIATPNIDRLAQGGLRFNRFHVTSICSSTRACLLTGRNHHAVGMGMTQESVLGFPGYTGRIPKSAATVARTLRDNGFNTMAVGKWHLTSKGEYSSAGPFERWPLGMGFERYYGFLGAETSQWAPDLVRDNTHIDPPRLPHEGYHLTEDLVDQAMGMVLDQQHASPSKPFYCYLATGAAHAPHQVAPEWVEPYRGMFDDGWEAYRARAHGRQVAEGIIPDGTKLTERPPWVPEWSSLSADERRLFARYMEVFAGFLAHTDAHIGRFIDFLEARGVLDDTLIFVLSDNGASAEGGIHGTLNEAAAWMGDAGTVADAVARIDDIGGLDAFNHYPYGWAWAGNAPLRLWKRYAWLGGVRTPLIVRWGDRLAEPGGVRQQFCHAVDVYSTILDATGIEQPAVVDGVTQQPVDGTSMLDAFADPAAPEHRSVQYFEMCGSRGMYADGWKAVTDHVANQFDERSHIIGSHDFDTDRWSLFDLTNDFSESTDLADEQPDRVRQLTDLWWAEAGRNQVLPLFEFPASMAYMHPAERRPPKRAEYWAGSGPVIESQLPVQMGGFTVTAEIEVGTAAQGVLCAIGDQHGGWAVYVTGGVPVAAVALLTSSARVAAPSPLPPGAHTVGMRYETAGGGRLVLVVDGADAGDAPLPGFFILPNLSTSGAGMLIGRDRGRPVTGDYVPPFPFTGTLHRVVIESTAPAARPDPVTELRTALAAD